MNLLKKRTSIFAMIVIMISLTFMSAFAAETQYANWVEVADAMSEHLQKAVEVYKPGDKDAKKAATDAVNVAYFKFYEKIGFEKTTMSAMAATTKMASSPSRSVSPRTAKNVPNLFSSSPIN